MLPLFSPASGFSLTCNHAVEAPSAQEPICFYQQFPVAWSRLDLFQSLLPDLPLSSCWQTLNLVNNQAIYTWPTWHTSRDFHWWLRLLPSLPLSPGHESDPWKCSGTSFLIEKCSAHTKTVPCKVDICWSRVLFAEKAQRNLRAWLHGKPGLLLMEPPAVTASKPWLPVITSHCHWRTEEAASTISLCSSCVSLLL